MLETRQFGKDHDETFLAERVGFTGTKICQQNENNCQKFAIDLDWGVI
jgi:hypothetical protein